MDTFTYNGDGQAQLQKQDSTGTTNHVWDGQNILLETNASNIIQVVYTLEPAITGSLISQRRSGTTSFFLFDVQGSTRQLANSRGRSPTVISTTPSATSCSQVAQQLTGSATSERRAITTTLIWSAIIFETGATTARQPVSGHRIQFVLASRPRVNTFTLATNQQPWWICLWLRARELSPMFREVEIESQWAASLWQYGCYCGKGQARSAAAD